MTLAYAMARPGPRSGEKGAPTASPNFGVELFALHIVPRGRLSTVGQIEKVADLVVHFPIGPCGQPTFERRGGDGPPGRSLPITRGSGLESPHPPDLGVILGVKMPSKIRPNFGRIFPIF